MRTRLVALAAFALVAAAAPPAEEPSRGWEGVWQGTVGGLEVRACFAQSGSYRFGDYYYLSHMRLISLQGDGADPGAYEEGPGSHPAAPRWQLTAPVGDAVTGNWTGRGRTLPIRLTRLARPSGAGGSCADRRFHAPRLAGVRVVERPAALGPLSYTRLILDHGGRFEGTSVETFRLPADGEAARRINAELLKPLGEGDGSWWDCLAGALEIGPSEGGEDQKLEPTLLTRRWLVVSRNVDSYCGGAHPNTELEYLTFARATGRTVDLLGWLNQRAVGREATGPGERPFMVLKPAFRVFVMAGARRPEEECHDVVADAEAWGVELTRTGFVFSPSLPRVVLACTAEFPVPFAKLRPYLTAEGAAYVAEIEREGGWVAIPTKPPR